MALSSGSEFLKKLEEAKKQQELRNKNTANLEPEITTLNDEEDTQISQLDDIKIDKTSSNKQKYIIFGISLILLFILTVITLKIITNNNKKQDDLIAQDQIIDKEFKTIDNTNNNTAIPPKNIENKLDINKIEQKEIPVEQKKEAKKVIEKKDPLNISEEKEFVPEIPIKNKNQKINKSKIKNQKQTKHKPTNLKHKTLNLKPKGYFVQVGAFTKQPSKILLNRLKKVQLSYTLYKTKVKGRYFTKVLVGPYKSRNSALDDLNMIRHITKNSGAFIIRFK